jgi:hypothetical protein
MTAADLEKATSSEPPPTGAWGLVIDSVGWMVEDPLGGGQLFDVAYMSGGKVELRASIEQPPFPSPTGVRSAKNPTRRLCGPPRSEMVARRSRSTP